MARLAAVLLCLFLIPTTGKSEEASPKLIRDYRLVSVRDALERGPALEQAAGTFIDGLYRFDAGQGLELRSPGVGESFTVEVTMRFRKVENWQKVIDFQNRARDTGLYVYEGQLQFYNLGIGGQIAVDQWVVLRLERDAATRTVKGFLDGLEVFNFIDTEGDAVFGDGPGRFFVDDEATSGSEVAAGEALRIRIWDGPGGR